jgi:hypothetical protein
MTRRSHRPNLPLPRWAYVPGESERPSRSRHAVAGQGIDFADRSVALPALEARVDGDVATLLMDVDENGGLFEGYQLKLNSYDLGVDIELADAMQRLRFEHPLR